MNECKSFLVKIWLSNVHLIFSLKKEKLLVTLTYD